MRVYLAKGENVNEEKRGAEIFLLRLVHFRGYVFSVQFDGGTNQFNLIN